MKSQIQWDMEIEYKYNAIVERKLTTPPQTTCSHAYCFSQGREKSERDYLAKIMSA